MGVCPSRSELEEFLTDRLPADHESRVLTHLDDCSSCQQILEDLTSVSVAERAFSDYTILMSGSNADSGKPYPLPSRIGQYTLIRELGHGGMGVVYLAEQAKLKRLVALKIIRHGVNATPAEVSRFCAEAEAVARLKHPNIVQIHEVGSQEGVYYLALEYVAGGSMDSYLAGTPQDPLAAAQLIETLARAVHHAHQRGILHRDLKPANVLLEEVEKGEGRGAGTLAFPKITDFGLAKRLEPGGGGTQSSLVMGTPSYIAPEQVSAKHGDVNQAVDIYGLGTLLYETLTGRPPFKGATPLSTLEQVVSQEPLAPSRFHRHVPRDLETICLKCLEKEPRRRYASAEALADDLSRFLAGRPITARPIRVWGRAWKWASRKPLEACLSVAVLLVSVMGITGVVWQWRRAVAERDRARREWYRADMVAAASALEVHNTLAARRSLDDAPPESRNWEWRHFQSQLDNSSQVLTGHEEAVVTIAFSPKGDRLVSGSHDHTLRLWELATGRELAVLRGHDDRVEAVAFSPDGRRVASGSGDKTVRLWDAGTGAALAVCRGHTGRITSLGFSPDGRKLVSSSITEEDPCRLWDAATGALVAVLPAPACDVSFSPDGARIVCCRSDSMHFLDAASGREIAAPRVNGAPVICSAVSPDGRRLVTGWGYPDNGLRLYDLRSGELLGVMSGHTNRVNSVAFSPDGRRMVSSSMDQTVRIWEAGRRTAVAVLRGHTSHSTQALFSPDGKHLVSASNDGTLRLWNAADGELVAVVQGHAAGVSTCAFSPDGAWLASASPDHTVRLWDTALLERNGLLRGHENYVYDVAFSPDGKLIGSSAWDNSVRLWDAVSGREVASLKGPGRETVQGGMDKQARFSDWAGFMLTLAFSPDGSQLVTGSRGSKVQFWDVKSTTLRRTVELPGGGVESLDFSPNGSRVAAALAGTNPYETKDCDVRLLDAQSGETLRVLTVHGTGVLAVRFAPDGRRLVSGGFDKTVRIWDVASGELIAALPGHSDSVASLAFSKDGGLLASASLDRTVRLWDMRTLRVLAVLPHASLVYGVAFSPDGTRLAAGCEDNTIRLWDVNTYQEVAELRGHRAYVHAVAFSPDGTRLASASGDFTVRIWDTLSHRERAGMARR